jgi:hypothetical protein
MKKIFFVLALLAAGCSSTSVLNSWKAPDAIYTADTFKKVAVLAFAKDDAARKQAEDLIAGQHKTFHATYPLFTGRQAMEDSLRIKNMLMAEGYDGIIIMRLLTTKANSKFVQGGINQSYTQNGIFYFQDYVKNGGYATDMDYVVATNFYSLKQGKLLWSGVTQSTNPKKLDKLVKEVSKEVVAKMREDKFLPE